MRLLFVFVYAILAIAISQDTIDNEEKKSKTPSPTELEVYELCLDINKVEINNMQWDKGSSSFWAQTEGIVYVYNPDESIDTFQTMKFPIIPDNTAANQRRLQQDTASLTDNDNVDNTDDSNKDQSDSSDSSSTSSSTSTSTTKSPLPTEFKFSGDEKKVGCWIEPDFHELNLRFKLYQYYHTAMKAVTIIQIPSIKTKEETTTVTLNTLPYQYSDAMVDIEYRLKWKKIKLTPGSIDGAVPIAPAPVSNGGTLKTPGIQPALPPPGTPPVDANAIIDDFANFDSDEATDNIIQADKELPSDDKNVADDIMSDVEKEEEEKGEEEETQKDDAELVDILPENEENSSTDWMLMAAFISAIVGFFVLVYICIYAYKQYGRVEYEKIGSSMKGASKLNRALGKVKRISLRNIGKSNNKYNNEYDEESRNIMHPSVSYTFDDD